MANYTIQRGDTLSQIAKNYGTTVSALQAANPQIYNPNVIRTGNTLNIPGQSSGNSSGFRVGGSNTLTSSSGNTETQTTGYRPVTNYTYNADGTRNEHHGYEKVGTSYDPSTGYLEHASGYKGQAYVGNDGRYYTPEGSLIREDSFLYPEGAKISKNGMYYDTGNGWQYAGYGTEGDMRTWTHLVPSTYNGAAPGTLVGSFGVETGSAEPTNKVQETITEIITPTVTTPTAAKSKKDLEVERSKNMRSQGLFL